jgi:hypothetical protein
MAEHPAILPVESQGLFLGGFRIRLRLRDLPVTFGAATQISGSREAELEFHPDIRERNLQPASFSRERIRTELSKQVIRPRFEGRGYGVATASDA